MEELVEVLCVLPARRLVAVLDVVHREGRLLVVQLYIEEPVNRYFKINSNHKSNDHISDLTIYPDYSVYRAIVTNSSKAEL